MPDCIYYGAITPEQYLHLNKEAYVDKDGAAFYSLRARNDKDLEDFKKDKDAKAEYYELIKDMPGKLLNVKGQPIHCFFGGFQEKEKPAEPDIKG